MHAIRFHLALLAVLSGCCIAPARAAESYDNCTGFIDSLPATIDTQGVWCLRGDLSTAITSGNAITIATNNVTIDCNDFKIGGLGAGDSSTATGIGATLRQNASVRHCSVRGFYSGIFVNGGAGHLVEDNRLDNNLRLGMVVRGDNNRVQRNRVYDTGGSPTSGISYGIDADADVIDNTVAGVFAAFGANTSAYGILLRGPGSEARGNQVRGLAVTGTGNAFGIYTTSPAATNAGNRISASAATPGFGIYGFADDTFCTDNTVINFAIAYSSCEYNFGNLPTPP